MFYTAAVGCLAVVVILLSVVVTVRLAPSCKGSSSSVVALNVADEPAEVSVVTSGGIPLESEEDGAKHMLVSGRSHEEHTHEPASLSEFDVLRSRRKSRWITTALVSGLAVSVGLLVLFVVLLVRAKGL